MVRKKAEPGVDVDKRFNLSDSALQITYSSDYFRELYDLAIKLIKSGNAFVCHQTADEISEYRYAVKAQSFS